MISVLRGVCLFIFVALNGGCVWVDGTGDQGSSESVSGEDRIVNETTENVGIDNILHENFLHIEITSRDSARNVAHVRLHGLIKDYLSYESYHLCVSVDHRDVVTGVSRHMLNYYLGTWNHNVDDWIEIDITISGHYKIDLKRVDGWITTKDRQECLGYIENYYTHEMYVN